VTVSGLTFEGERLADSPIRDLGGIYFLGAGGRVEDCRFSGFRGSTLGYNFYCIGVGAANPVSLGTGVVDLQVLRSAFGDNTQSIQIWIWQVNRFKAFTTFSSPSMPWPAREAR
jgi:hypothetical protein